MCKYPQETFSLGKGKQLHVQENGSWLTTARQNGKQANYHSQLLKLNQINSYFLHISLHACYLIFRVTLIFFFQEIPKV